MTLVLGIDPGQTGGLALVQGGDGRRLKLLSAMPMPLLNVRKKKIADTIAAYEFFCMYVIDIGVTELVSSMPAQGVASSFQFGRAFGGIETLPYRLCATQEYATPSVWKQHMGLSKDKNASIDLATRMFGRAAAEKYWPLKKHDGVAEAALIAAYWIKKEF